MKGADFICIRELTGGMYFGKKQEPVVREDGVEEAYDTNYYSRPEVERILKVGYQYARQRREDGVEEAYDTNYYSRPEVERILKVGYQYARQRRKHLTVVDKANVLASSRLWRKIAQEMAPQYPDVTTDYMYVDNAAMRMIQEPPTICMWTTPPCA